LRSGFIFILFGKKGAMMSEINLENHSPELESLCNEFRANNQIPPEKFDLYQVKRGLRNPDGTGVMAGLTLICNVHGYLIDDGELVPDVGKLTYRGIDLNDIVNGCIAENRFGFEEVAWLLLFGKQPTKSQLSHFREVLSSCRELPEYFAEDMIIKAPSKNVMNKLARSVLALYSYDKDPDNPSLENNMRQAIQLIARLPTIMTYAYQVKRRHFDKESMYFHPLNPNHSTAESILNAIRPDQSFTDEEAKLLDICMMVHAEHGGGNNSTFTTRVLSSTGTDIYSAISAAIGSLKGPRHGGANHRVMMMMRGLMEGVKDWKDDDEVAHYLGKILRRQVPDYSGLLYGIGHAVYTLSDPRAVILKNQAKKLADKRGMKEQFDLFERVERLAPEVFAKVTGKQKVMCANVDFYSGLVYEMLGIPSDLYTPLFAVSRIAGWCAHRIEEMETCGRIMRPAYRSLSKNVPYVPIDQRT
jgi:citrate synthase